MKDKFAWAVILFFAIGTACVVYQNMAGMDDLKKHGVVVKSLIYGRSYTKGTYTYDIKFVFRNQSYENTFRSSGRTFNFNDSVSVRINSQNPNGFCILERK